MPTLVRYLLFQLPGCVLVVGVLLALRRWFDLPLEVEVAIVTVWVAKDLALYPLVKPAYAIDSRSEIEKLAGETAVVRRALAPTGTVVLRGELWQAEVAPGEPLPVPKESRVQVVGGSGLSLLVARAPAQKASRHCAEAFRRDPVGLARAATHGSAEDDDGSGTGLADFSSQERDLPASSRRRGR